MREPSPSAQIPDLPAVAADVLMRLRERAPRVHCITNAVAQTFTANVLLATGAVPSMTIASAEVGEFVARAQGLLINLGTFDRERTEAAQNAIDAATDRGMPWVLDPVFVDRSAPRAALARDLAARGPAAIRLNPAEFAALTDLPAAERTAEDLIRGYARKSGSVIALTGPVDLVTDGERTAHIENGSPLMAKVTAMGDALSALVAACLAVEPDPWRATASALLIFGVAGDVAGRSATGPGSFPVALIDTLHNLDRATLTSMGKVA
jgi:hydroxyethylthiazole kinase